MDAVDHHQQPGHPVVDGIVTEVPFGCENPQPAGEHLRGRLSAGEQGLLKALHQALDR